MFVTISLLLLFLPSPSEPCRGFSEASTRIVEACANIKADEPGRFERRLYLHRMRLALRTVRLHVEDRKKLPCFDTL